MEKIVFDTNILIDISRGNSAILNTIKKLAPKSLFISAITGGEFLNGARNKNELHLIQRHLNQYSILPLTSGISELFVELMNKYTLSHKPFVPDLLIAATCIQYNLPLYTSNVKDFRFITGLKLV